MNSFIKKTITFFLFSTLFYSFALQIWGKYLPSELKPNLNYRLGSNGHMYSRLKEVKETKDVDLLFIGSSHAYRGFDTRIFNKNGYSSFNLGSSSQTPIQSLLLIKRYLKDLNPQLIIFEVYPGTLSSDGVESAVDIVANEKIDFYSIEMALNINHTKVFNTLIYAKMQEILNQNSSFEESKIKGVDKYIKGGFVEREISYYSPQTLPKINIEINEKQEKAFDEIINLVKKVDIPIILVYAPIPPSNYTRYSNNTYFDSLMSQYSTYYNFNEIIQLDDSLHFYDSHHLNQKGVEIFNEELIKILEKNEAVN